MKNKCWSENLLPPYISKTSSKNGMGGLKDIRGNFLPSLTTIRDTMRSPAEKTRLAHWWRNNGSQASLACQIGKLGHRHIASYLNGKSTSCPQLIQRHWQQALPILDKIHNVRLVEGAVFHYYEGYAGRVDCVGQFGSLPETVIEFKFSNRIRIYDEQKLQVAAYIGALNRHYLYPYGVKIRHGLLITITPHEVDITFLDTPTVHQYWKQWQKQVSQFWLQHRDID
jgi:genome maintenance exonuclease 1